MNLTYAKMKVCAPYLLARVRGDVFCLAIGFICASEFDCTKNLCFSPSRLSPRGEYWIKLV